MSKDTDHESEDDLIEEHLAKLVKLLERHGRKVTGLRIEFERGSATQFGSGELTTEEEMKIRKAFSEAGLEAPVGKECSFELRPVDDQEAETDDFLMLIQDDKPLH